MSEHLRTSSPLTRSASLSGSPGRPSPLSRPHWPWSTYTHRSSSSSISVHSSNSSTVGSLIESRSSAVSSPSTAMLPTRPPTALRNPPASVYPEHAHEELTTRQWSFNAFEWVVRDVHKLRDFVESSVVADASGSDEGHEEDTGDFEVLKESPMIWDGKYKLEIAKTALPENGEPNTAQTPTLSLYITSLLMDFAHAEYEICSSMFAAIKCQDDRAGERGARAQWAWEYWQDGWIFRQESEVWECPLPSLSSLLENPRIKETDSFVICVQMHSPVGPFFPQQPSAYYVPRDLLEGLEASLDNANTGDVQFVCVERMDIGQEMPEMSPAEPRATTPRSRASSASSHSIAGPRTVARKRIIYAHSDILTRRSDYFATMLSSSFSENAPEHSLPGERKIYTVVVEEVDFITIYWLLKWVYANWILFRKEDDPREAIDGIGAGWSARGFTTPGAPDEWEWKTFSKRMLSEGHVGVVSDTRSVTSAESARSNGGVAGANGKEKQSYMSPSTSASMGMRSTHASTSKVAPSPPKAGVISPTTPTRPPGARQSNTSSASGSSSALAATLSPTSAPASRRSSKPVSLTIPPSSSKFGPAHFPMSPHAPRGRAGPSADPHPHPTPEPPPASALSMYSVAHRYAMPGLASLALEHILSTITPQTSFAVLLATATWEELHSLVEDYVVDKWDEVSVSGEFERCCEEVANGEWGPQGGKTLMALFRRLRSPVATAYSRN